MAHFWTAAFLIAAAGSATAQIPARPPLQRHYEAGQTLAYHMTGDNDGWHYSADALSTVRTDVGSGGFFEDIAWSNLVSNGQPQGLPAAMTGWRQRLSLDPARPPSPPDLSQVDPRMIGPITDLLTFYADLWLANKLSQLNKPGDHVHFPNPMTPSWADGTRVRLGEDAMDFDMTLTAIDPATGTAMLEVKHVPPSQARIHLPAPWMRTAITGAPNWVEVRKLDDGTFAAAVGEETFDVTITISLQDGHILRAEMTNPVRTIGRTCTDEALDRCGEPKPRTILRRIVLEQSR